MARSKLVRAVEELRGRRILVVGDLMLDRYLFGNVRRISPEAPVPVVEVERDQQVLGGAANVAANIASLGGRVEVLGLAGRDAGARQLRSMLEEQGIGAGGVITDGSRPTTAKTRVIGGHQQVVRVDREGRRPPPRRVDRRLLAALAERVAESDGVLVSDYGKGVVRPSLLDRLRELRAEHGVPVVVDPKDIHFSNYRDFALVTPNENEASLAAGCALRTEEELVREGSRLRTEMNLGHLLITRGAAGMSLFGSGKVTHIRTMAREVFDVSGAGDTVAATMALCLAAGIPAEQAAHLANAAAAEVVAHVGTAVVTPEGLLRSLKRIEAAEKEEP